MRTENEVMDLIMKKAMVDDRIRAIAMDGSRVNKNAVHNQYSDFDIVYYVIDVREFTKDKSWINYFLCMIILMNWKQKLQNILILCVTKTKRKELEISLKKEEKKISIIIRQFISQSFYALHKFTIYICAYRSVVLMKNTMWRILCITNALVLLK